MTAPTSFSATSKASRYEKLPAHRFLPIPARRAVQKVPAACCLLPRARRRIKVLA
jgi:hypothetical protein